MLPLTAVLLLATSVVYAIPIAESHTEGPLLNKWYHEDDHPVQALFKRQAVGDAASYAAVGTPEWSAGFPSGAPDTASLPQAWVDALNATVKAGKIPDIPVSTGVSGMNPVYPTGYDPTSPAVCSATYKCVIPGDLWNAPEGVIGLSFDDGPLPPSDQLYQFLANNSEHATHFFIGMNIIYYPNEFTTAFANQDDIAVHTWTHPYMTTKTNLEVVGELGWTMELIHNSTGGRVPKYWRPPYGDSDMRVRAIAKEVFGLTTVVWNQDSGDWSLTVPNSGTSTDKIQQEMTQWLTGSKNPGLIILEHELSDLSVKAFMDAYPLMVSNGWKRLSVAQLDGGPSYQNAWNSTSQVNPAEVGVTAQLPTTSTAHPSATSANSSSASSSGVPGSSHTAQANAAIHFNIASLALTSVVTAIVAAAGGIIMA